MVQVKKNRPDVKFLYVIA